MVVSDDHIDAVLHNLFDLFSCCNSAVDSDHEGAVLFEGKFESVANEAFFKASAVRDIEENFGANGPEEFGEKSGCSHPVYVVISIDENGLLSLDSLKDPLNSLVHVGKEVGIVEIGEFGIEKFVNFFHGFKAARDQDLSGNGMDVELRNYLIEQSRVFLGVYPRRLV